MWSRLTGKSNDKFDGSSNRTGQRKAEERASTRRASESIKPSSSSAKPSRGDDYVRVSDASPRSYSSSSKAHQSQAKATSNDISGQPGKGVDWDERGDRRDERRRDRSSSRDGTLLRRDSNGQGGKEKRDRKDRKRERTSSRSESVYEQSRAGETSNSTNGNFAAQVENPGFSQFPGQYDAGIPEPSSKPSYPLAHMSAHVPDQFPGQFPSQSTAPYRPPLAASEGGPGLASEYYGDQGQSVSDQPGVRPQPPDLIIGAEPHLQAALPVAAPPPEPSASGGVGAAASFFNSEEDFVSSPPPMNNVPGPGRYSPSSAAPSSYHTAPAPASGTHILGPVTAGVLGYAMSHHGSGHNQSISSPSTGAGNSSQRPPPTQQPPSHIEAYHDSVTTDGRPSNPGKQSSYSSNIPLYAAGAGAAGLAAAAYHHDHHSSHHSSSANMYRPSTAMAQKHRHRGPVDKFIEFWTDPDGVGQFEEYTEYIGVCKYCFAPGSSPRDAPRKHHYRRRKSNERLGSNIRVDKDSRYWSSDGEGRRKNRKSWLATGLAGYGLAKVSQGLFKQNHDFEDTYSVQSGRVHRSNSSFAGRGGRHSPDRRSRTSQGVLRRSSESASRRRSNSRDRIETGITSDGRTYKKDTHGEFFEGSIVTHRPIRRHSRSRSSSRDRKRSRERIETGMTSDGRLYKKDSHGGVFGGPTMTTYDTRWRSRSRSRSRSRDRRNKLEGGVIGAAIGSAVGATTMRHGSRSPQKVFVQTKHKGREHSSEHEPHSNHARASSYVEISGPGPHESGAVGGFFNPPPEKHGSSHRKKKKKRQTGFFNFANSSSSSADVGLAFGEVIDRPRNKKPSKSKTKDHRNADAALLGLGAAAAALALNESRRREKGKYRSNNVAVKELKESNGRHTNHSHRSRSHSPIDSEDDLWESASEGDDSSIDLGLAYGASRRKSQESLLSESSGTDKWGWRWGNKKRKGSSRREGTVDAGVSPRITATSVGLAGAAVEAAIANNHFPATDSVSSLPALQHVYPVSTSDPSRFDVVRQSSVVSSNQPVMTSRPAPVPLQQPQPVTPISHTVYATSGPQDYSYTATTGAPVISSVPLQASITRDSADITLNKIPGSFPEGDSSHIIPQKYDERTARRSQRRNSSPTPQVIETQPAVSSQRRRASTRDDSSTVRFDLPEDQEDKEDRERRERRRKRKADKEKRQEAERREAKEQAEIENRHSTVQRPTSGKDFEDKQPEGIVTIPDRSKVDVAEPEEDSRTSWATPIAAGIAGAAIGVTIANADQPKIAGRRDKPREENRNGGSFEQEVKETRQFEAPNRADDQVNKAERQAKIIKQAAEKIRRSSSHENYAAYFTPPELLHKPSDQKQIIHSVDNTGVTSYQIPEIITIEPSSARNPFYPPAFTVSGTGDDFDLNHMTLPWQVPRLNLIEPTPPHSRAASTRGENSPIILPSDISQQEDDEPKSGTISRVSSGDSETLDRIVEIPIEMDEHPTDKYVEAGNPENGTANNLVNEEDTPEFVSQVGEGQSGHMPGEFGDDLDFTATVAAGLQDTGFDPDIVINDPNFRRRDSPPGSNDEELHRQSFAETIMSLAMDSPGTEGAPPQIGFVEGEIPPTPKDEVHLNPKEGVGSDSETKISNKERKRREKAAKRQSEEQYFVAGDTISSDLSRDNSFQMPNGKSQSSQSTVPTSEGAIHDFEPLTRSRKSKGKKSKRESNDFGTRTQDSPTETEISRDVYFDAADVKSEGSQHRSDLYEPTSVEEKIDPTRQIEDSLSKNIPSGAAIAPVAEDFDAEQTKETSKRGSSRYEDATSDMSFSANAYELDDSKSSLREKNGNLIEDFGTSTNILSRQSQPNDSPSEATFEDFEKPKKKNKKSKSRRATGLGEDMSSTPPEAVIDESRANNQGDVKLREWEKEKRRESREGTIREESGRITRDLPAKVSMLASLGRFPNDTESILLTNSEDRDRVDDNNWEDPRIRRLDHPGDQEQTTHEDRPLSFLGERLEIPPPPDILRAGDRPFTDFITRLDVDEEYLPPLPQSRPTSPIAAGNAEDIPPLASSGPASPVTTPTNQHRRRSMLHGSDGASSVAAASPTAVPLVFRRPPFSPSSKRSTSSPAVPLPSAPAFTPRQRQARPLSTEFKDSREFRPLWLVERHSSRQVRDAEEVYPSLPSSHSTSRSSSVHDAENHDLQQSLDPELTGLETMAIARRKSLSIDTSQDLPPDLLDSQQTTPTATRSYSTQGLGITEQDPERGRRSADKDEDHRKALNDLGQRSASHSLERMSHDALQSLPSRHSTSPSQDGKETSQDLNSLPMTSSAAKYTEPTLEAEPSMLGMVGIGALLGGAAATLALGAEHRHSQSSDLDANVHDVGAFTGRRNELDAETLANETPVTHEAFEEPENFTIKKSRKKDKKQRKQETLFPSEGIMDNRESTKDSTEVLSQNESPNDQTYRPAVDVASETGQPLALNMSRTSNMDQEMKEEDRGFDDSGSLYHSDSLPENPGPEQPSIESPDNLNAGKTPPMFEDTNAKAADPWAVADSTTLDDVLTRENSTPNALAKGLPRDQAVNVMIAAAQGAPEPEPSAQVNPMLVDFHNEGWESFNETPKKPMRRQGEENLELSPEGSLVQLSREQEQMLDNTFLPHSSGASSARNREPNLSSSSTVMVDSSLERVPGEGPKIDVVIPDIKLNTSQQSPLPGTEPDMEIAKREDDYETPKSSVNDLESSPIDAGAPSVAQVINPFSEEDSLKTARYHVTSSPQTEKFNLQAFNSVEWRNKDLDIDLSPEQVYLPPDDDLDLETPPQTPVEELEHAVENRKTISSSKVSPQHQADSREDRQADRPIDLESSTSLAFLPEQIGKQDSAPKDVPREEPQETLQSETGLQPVVSYSEVPGKVETALSSNAESTGARSENIKLQSQEDPDIDATFKPAKKTKKGKKGKPSRLENSTEERESVERGASESGRLQAPDVSTMLSQEEEQSFEPPTEVTQEQPMETPYVEEYPITTSKKKAKKAKKSKRTQAETLDLEEDSLAAKSTSLSEIPAVDSEDVSNTSLRVEVQDQTPLDGEWAIPSKKKGKKGKKQRAEAQDVQPDTFASIRSVDAPEDVDKEDLQIQKSAEDRQDVYAPVEAPSETNAARPGSVELPERVVSPTTLAIANQGNVESVQDNENSDGDDLITQSDSFGKQGSQSRREELLSLDDEWATPAKKKGSKRSKKTKLREQEQESSSGAELAKVVREPEMSSASLAAPDHSLEPLTKHDCREDGSPMHEDGESVNPSRIDAHLHGRHASPEDKPSIESKERGNEKDTQHEEGPTSQSSSGVSVGRDAKDELPINSSSAKSALAFSSRAFEDDEDIQNTISRKGIEQQDTLLPTEVRESPRTRSLTEESTADQPPIEELDSPLSLTESQREVQGIPAFSASTSGIQLEPLNATSEQPLETSITTGPVKDTDSHGFGTWRTSSHTDYKTQTSRPSPLHSTAEASLRPDSPDISTKRDTSFQQDRFPEIRHSLSQDDRILEDAIQSNLPLDAPGDFWENDSRQVEMTDQLPSGQELVAPTSDAEVNESSRAEDSKEDVAPKSLPAEAGDDPFNHPESSSGGITDEISIPLERSRSPENSAAETFPGSNVYSNTKEEKKVKESQASAINEERDIEPYANQPEEAVTSVEESQKETLYPVEDPSNLNISQTNAEASSLDVGRKPKKDKKKAKKAKFVSWDEQPEAVSQSEATAEEPTVLNEPMIPEHVSPGQVAQDESIDAKDKDSFSLKKNEHDQEKAQKTSAFDREEGPKKAELTDSKAKPNLIKDASEDMESPTRDVQASQKTPDRSDQPGTVEAVYIKKTKKDKKKARKASAFDWKEDVGKPAPTNDRQVPLEPEGRSSQEAREQPFQDIQNQSNDPEEVYKKAKKDKKKARRASAFSWEENPEEPASLESDARTEVTKELPGEFEASTNAMPTDQETQDQPSQRIQDEPGNLEDYARKTKKDKKKAREAADYDWEEGSNKPASTKTEVDVSQELEGEAEALSSDLQIPQDVQDGSYDAEEVPAKQSKKDKKKAKKGKWDWEEQADRSVADQEHVIFNKDNSEEPAEITDPLAFQEEVGFAPKKSKKDKKKAKTPEISPSKEDADVSTPVEREIPTEPVIAEETVVPIQELSPPERENLEPQPARDTLEPESEAIDTFNNKKGKKAKKKAKSKQTLEWNMQPDVASPMNEDALTEDPSHEEVGPESKGLSQRPNETSDQAAVDERPMPDDFDVFEAKKSKKDKKKSKKAQVLDWNEEPSITMQANDFAGPEVDRYETQVEKGAMPEGADSSYQVVQENKEIDDSSSYGPMNKKKDKKKAKKAQALAWSEEAKADESTPLTSPVSEPPTTKAGNEDKPDTRLEPAAELPDTQSEKDKLATQSETFADSPVIQEVASEHDEKSQERCSLQDPSNIAREKSVKFADTPDVFDQSQESTEKARGWSISPKSSSLIDEDLRQSDYQDTSKEPAETAESVHATPEEAPEPLDQDPPAFITSKSKKKGNKGQQPIIWEDDTATHASRDLDEVEAFSEVQDRQSTDKPLDSLLPSSSSNEVPEAVNVPNPIYQSEAQEGAQAHEYEFDTAKGDGDLKYSHLSRFEGFKKPSIKDVGGFRELSLGEGPSGHGDQVQDDTQIMIPGEEHNIHKIAQDERSNTGPSFDSVENSSQRSPYTELQSEEPLEFSTKRNKKNKKKQKTKPFEETILQEPDVNTSLLDPEARRSTQQPEPYQQAWQQSKQSTEDDLYSRGLPSENQSVRVPEQEKFAYHPVNESTSQGKKSKKRAHGEESAILPPEKYRETNYLQDPQHFHLHSSAPGLIVAPPEASAAIEKYITADPSRERNLMDNQLLPHEQKTLASSFEDNLSMSTGETVAAATFGAGLASGFFGEAERKKSKKGGKKKKKSKRWAESEDEPAAASSEIEKGISVPDPNVAQNQESQDYDLPQWRDVPSGMEASSDVGSHYQHQELEEIPSVTSNVEHDDRSYRDSAVHMSDSPMMPDILPRDRSVRDSGYQGTEASPVFDTDSEHVEGATNRPENESYNQSRTETDRQTQPGNLAEESRNIANDSENPLNISVEVGPDYEVSISRGEDDGGRRGATSSPRANASVEEDVQRQERSRSKEIESPSRSSSAPRGVSPVNSTTKERSSVLFQSSPSTREESANNVTEHRDSLSINDQGTAPRGYRSVVGDETPNDAGEAISKRPALNLEPTSPTRELRDIGISYKEPHASLFGGPMGHNSDMQPKKSPPLSASGYESSSGRPLNTIKEKTSEESPLHKKSRAISDVREPELGVKTVRRGTPQPVLQHRVSSPHGTDARKLGLISTDDLISRLSWPEVDEDGNSVDLDRSRSQNTDRRPASRHSNVSVPVADFQRQREGERRSLSGASIKSGESIHAIIRTPDQVRSASRVSNRSSGTPPLRRTDRSVSSDLRAASRLSETSPREAKRQAEAELDASIPSSSTYDPVKDKGKGRVREMAGVFVSHRLAP